MDMENKKAKNIDEAWELLEEPNGPHGYMQLKGTDICMDLHCKCGHLSHVDGYFAYSVKCPSCGTVYATNYNIELIELTEGHHNPIVGE